MHCATRRAALRPRWLASATPTARRKDCVGQSPPTNKGGPWAAKPKDRPKNAPASAADQPPAGASSAAIIRQRGRKRRAARRCEAITCRVSLLIPDEQRSWWHYLARCPVCGRPHLGRSRELAGVTSTRKLPCGHWVVIVVARSYGQTSSGAAA